MGLYTILDSSVWVNGRWHQVLPRPMVADDIYPPGYFRGKCEVRIPAQYLAPPWAREAALERRVVELESKLKGYEPINTFDDLNIEQWRTRALTAESELRLMTNIKDCYVRQSDRNHAQIHELKSTVKVNSDLIELQSKRLKNARNSILRVRQACDVYEPEDSGPKLDP
jgi:hypothetical protein